MTNLTPHILAAAARSQRYDFNDLIQKLRELLRKSELKIDWDDGAGEEWATLSTPGEFMAILWRRGPLAICLSELPVPVTSWLRDEGLDVMSVPSFDDPTYSLEVRAVDVLRGTAPWPDVVPLVGMTIRDLWWATV